MTAKELQEKINNGLKVKIFDIRNKEKFNIIHLKGAINIERGKLIEDPEKYMSKTEKVYITCNGGNSATYIANILIKEGYNIESLKEGMNPLVKETLKLTR